MRQKIMDDVKEAMKSGDKVRLGALRMVQATLKDQDIAARGDGKEPLNDEAIFSLLQKMIKQRLEAAKIYLDAKRQDLEELERKEAEILQALLPQQMSEEEVKSAIEKAIQEIEATTIKDMGKVISSLKDKFSGRMDFAKASAWVKEMLSR